MYQLLEFNLIGEFVPRHITLPVGIDVAALFSNLIQNDATFVALQDALTSKATLIPLNDVRYITEDPFKQMPDTNETWRTLEIHFRGELDPLVITRPGQSEPMELFEAIAARRVPMIMLKDAYSKRAYLLNINTVRLMTENGNVGLAN